MTGSVEQRRSCRLAVRIPMRDRSHLAGGDRIVDPVRYFDDLSGIDTGGRVEEEPHIRQSGGPVPLEMRSEFFQLVHDFLHWRAPLWQIAVAVYTPLGVEKTGV